MSSAPEIPIDISQKNEKNAQQDTNGFEVFSVSFRKLENPCETKIKHAYGISAIGFAMPPFANIYEFDPVQSKSIKNQCSNGK